MQGATGWPQVHERMQEIDTGSARSHCVNSIWKRACACRKTMNR